jgi:Ca2+-binding RTX toxin-like protein
VVAALLHAAPAWTATVRLQGKTIEFRAAPGETNHVAVKAAASGFVDVEDTGAPVTPGEGCVALSEHRARCASDYAFSSYDIRLGDQDDGAKIELWSYEWGLLDGGAGADELRPGGSAPNTLRGGPGADTLVGNACVCPNTPVVADYSDHVFGVSVDLTDTAPDGGTEDAAGDTLIDINRVTGTPADDFIRGTSGFNEFFGGGGDDELWGGDENPGYPGDVLHGEDGDDELYGGAGEDQLDGGPGADLIEGGSGVWRDLASYLGRTDDLTIDLADPGRDGGLQDGIGDVLVGIEWIWAGDGDDLLIGSDGNDDLAGVGGADRIEGGGGADNLGGGDGDDSLEGGLGGDRLEGGYGFDEVDYSQRINDVFVRAGPTDGEAGENDDVREDVEALIGGAGDDYLSGGVVLFGGDGDDELVSWTWDAELYGEDGADVLRDGSGPSVLDGGGGADELHGGGGTDLASYAGRTAKVEVDLASAPDNAGEVGEGDSIDSDVEGAIGGSGDDRLVGNGLANVFFAGAGADTVLGGSGDDHLRGSLGADSLAGGDGFDVVDYSDRTAAVHVDLDGEVGDDGVAGEGDTVAADVEDVVGGDGDDVLLGSDADNYLLGGPGADELTGLLGQDALFGEDGNDLIRSRDELEDYVSCEAGADAVTADRADVVEADCEAVDLPSLPAPPPPPSPPPASPPPPPPPAAPPPAPQPPAKPRPPRVLRCVVPNVVKKKLAVAKRDLLRARCRPGKITTRFSQRVGKGRVLRQSHRAGARLRIGTRVHLIVSRGPRR